MKELSQKSKRYHSLLPALGEGNDSTIFSDHLPILAMIPLSPSPQAVVQKSSADATEHKMSDKKSELKSELRIASWSIGIKGFNFDERDNSREINARAARVRKAILQIITHNQLDAFVLQEVFLERAEISPRVRVAGPDGTTHSENSLDKLLYDQTSSLLAKGWNIARYPDPTDPRRNIITLYNASRLVLDKNSPVKKEDLLVETKNEDLKSTQAKSDRDHFKTFKTVFRLVVSPVNSAGEDSDSDDDYSEDQLGQTIVLYNACWDHHDGVSTYTEAHIKRLIQQAHQEHLPIVSDPSISSDSSDPEAAAQPANRSNIHPIGIIIGDLGQSHVPLNHPVSTNLVTSVVFKPAQEGESKQDFQGAAFTDGALYFWMDASGEYHQAPVDTLAPDTGECYQETLHGFGGGPQQRNELQRQRPFISGAVEHQIKIEALTQDPNIQEQYRRLVVQGVHIGRSTNAQNEHMIALQFPYRGCDVYFPEKLPATAAELEKYQDSYIFIEVKWGEGSYFELYYINADSDFSVEKINVSDSIEMNKALKKSAGIPDDQNLRDLVSIHLDDKQFYTCITSYASSGHIPATIARYYRWKRILSTYFNVDEVCYKTSGISLGFQQSSESAIFISPEALLKFLTYPATYTSITNNDAPLAYNIAALFEDYASKGLGHFHWRPTQLQSISRWISQELLSHSNWSARQIEKYLYDQLAASLRNEHLDPHCSFMRRMQFALGMCASTTKPQAIYPKSYYKIFNSTSAAAKTSPVDLKMKAINLLADYSGSYWNWRRHHRILMYKLILVLSNSNLDAGQLSFFLTAVMKMPKTRLLNLNVQGVPSFVEEILSKYPSQLPHATARQSTSQDMKKIDANVVHDTQLEQSDRSSTNDAQSHISNDSLIMSANFHGSCMRRLRFIIKMCDEEASQAQSAAKLQT